MLTRLQFLVGIALIVVGARGAPTGLWSNDPWPRPNRGTAVNLWERRWIHIAVPRGTTLGAFLNELGLSGRKTWVRTECAGPTWELSQLGDKALTIRAAWIAVGEKRPEDDPRCSESR